MLKFKAIIYRYTGVYLAEREEQQYMNSKAGLRAINEMALALKDQSNAYGLALGTWQANNGFLRPLSRLRYKQGKLWFFLAELHESWLAVKADTRKLCWKFGLHI